MPNPNIPLSVATPNIDPVGSGVKALTLKNLMTQGRAQEYALGREKQRVGLLQAGAPPQIMAMMGFDETAKRLQGMISAGIADQEKLGQWQDRLMAQGVMTLALSRNPERLWPKVRGDIIMSAPEQIRDRLEQIFPLEYDEDWMLSAANSMLPDEIKAEVQQSLAEARAGAPGRPVTGTRGPAAEAPVPAPGVAPAPSPYAAATPEWDAAMQTPGPVPARAEPEIAPADMTGTVEPTLLPGATPSTVPVTPTPFPEERRVAPEVDPGIEDAGLVGHPMMMAGGGTVGDVLELGTTQAPSGLDEIDKWVQKRYDRYESLMQRADEAQRQADAARDRGNTIIANKKEDRAEELRDQANKAVDYDRETVMINGKPYNVPERFAHKYIAHDTPLVSFEGANIGGQIRQEDLGKKAQTDIDVGLLEASEQKAALFRMQQLFRPEFTEYATRAKMVLLGRMEKGGRDIPAEDRRQLADYHRWRSGALSALNNYIKAITGAALSEAEAKRIRAAFPDPGESWYEGDSATEFQEKLYTALRNARMAEARYHYIKTKGLKVRDVGEGEWDAGGLSLEDMPHLINQRGLELEQQFKAQGLSGKQLEEEVTNILAEEFGLL